MKWWNSYELFLELLLELSKDDHTIDSTSLQNIMQNHHLQTLQIFIIGMTLKLNQFARFIIKRIIISIKKKNNSKSQACVHSLLLNSKKLHKFDFVNNSKVYWIYNHHNNIKLICKIIDKENNNINMTYKLISKKHLYIMWDFKIENIPQFDFVE